MEVTSSYECPVNYLLPAIMINNLMISVSLLYWLLLMDYSYHKQWQWSQVLLGNRLLLQTYKLGKGGLTEVK